MIHSRFMKLVLAACVLSSLAAGPRAAVAQDDRAAPPGQVMIDLDFKGGTVLDYVEALRRANDSVNIVVSPETAAVPMEPVELKRVTLQAAIELLEDMGGRDEAGWVMIQVSGGNAAHGALPVYRVIGVRTGPPGRAPKAIEIESGVWSLKAIMKSGMTAEDVLTAIETALELFGDEHAPAKLRFHAETGLLLARAPDSQIRTIYEVLKALEKALPKEDHGAKIKEIERSAERQLQMRTFQVQEEANRETAQWRTRAELYEKEIENMRHQANDVEVALRTVMMERKELMDKLARCQAQLDGRRERNRD